LYDYTPLVTWWLSGYKSITETERVSDRGGVDEKVVEVDEVLE